MTASGLIQPGPIPPPGLAVVRDRKAAEAVQKHDERFTLRHFSLAADMLVVLTVTDHGQLIRPAGSDPAGTLTLSHNQSHQ